MSETPLSSLATIDILDHETLLSLKSLERPEDPVSFLGDLIDTFIRETPNVLSALRDALEIKSVTAAHYHAHQLKGLASNIGLVRLAAYAESIEDSLELRKIPDPELTWTQLEAYRREAIECLLSDWKD